MITVDLQAKVISPNHEIFFARPGSGYRLMPSFIQNSAAIIDLPRLDLVNGLAFDEQPDLDAKIMRSRAIRKWFQQGIDQPFPSVELEDYADVAEDRTLSQLRSVINGYIDKAKIGDLVLTVPGGWNRDAVVGEFDTVGTEIGTFEAPELYLRETLNGRSVNWLASIRKNSLNEGIINIVHKPNAFVLLPRSLRREIYALTYPGYIIGDECSTRFDVTSESYRSIDDLLLQAFFNFVAANTKAVSEGREDDILSFAEGAFVDAGAFNMDLRTEISSPGFLNLSSLSITPLVVAALFSLAVNVGPEAVQAAENGQVRIGNSLAPADDRCVAEVNEKAMRQLRLLGLDRWSVACEKARRASQNTGVNGPARVRQQP